MQGAKILVAFFLLFMAASLLIPPMFPGNAFCALVGGAVNEYPIFWSAAFNGVFYGVILWLIFVLISNRFEGEK